MENIIVYFQRVKIFPFYVMITKTESTACYQTKLWKLAVRNGTSVHPSHDQDSSFSPFREQAEVLKTGKIVYNLYNESLNKLLKLKNVFNVLNIYISLRPLSHRPKRSVPRPLLRRKQIGICWLARFTLPYCWYMVYGKHFSIIYSSNPLLCFTECISVLL